MTKIIKIDSCKDCPFADIRQEHEGCEKDVYCLKQQKVVLSFKRNCGVGNGCPLEDLEDSFECDNCGVISNIN